MGGPLKEKYMPKDKKEKSVCANDGAFSARRATYQLSNGEEGSKFRKF